MAVYTEVGFDEADALVRRLGLGALTDLRGIRSGIENTNYYASTTEGQWVLTLFERLPREQLPYYLRLMQHLARHGIPVPAPQADDSGEVLHTVAGKPAAVVTRLPGGHRLAPQAGHCRQVGALLARVHVAGADFTLTQPHLRGLAWWQEVTPTVLPHLQPGQAELLQSELAFQQELAASPAGQALPRGHIHADLFRDNVMFDDTAGGDVLCGFFDFYFAGVDVLLFDVAVCLNDWCTDAGSGRLDEARAQAFMAGYAEARALDGNERRLLPALMRAAALRFWISRLWDWHLPRDAALLQPKDPTHFERVLRACRLAPWHPPA
ncbi:homoserine kinase [Pseudorhodoferax sp.]|uniref:homoserine kinase n=1 Tax=Pseudorhodoferax sp. TaxID=1993553 RepID=UPI002DD65CFB|nr:homoserine kinase [Pseudorhodoferax sp.]